MRITLDMINNVWENADVQEIEHVVDTTVAVSLHSYLTLHLLIHASFIAPFNQYWSPSSLSTLAYPPHHRFCWIWAPHLIRR